VLLARLRVQRLGLGEPTKNPEGARFQFFNPFDGLIHEQHRHGSRSTCGRIVSPTAPSRDQVVAMTGEQLRRPPTCGIGNTPRRFRGIYR
jgi:hypothetical protein